MDIYTHAQYFRPVQDRSHTYSNEAQRQTDYLAPMDPNIKEKVKQSIQNRRNAMGLGDITIKTEPTLPIKLTPAEEQKRLQRREKNRAAAARCRDRQRQKAESLYKETQKLEYQNETLKRQIRELNDEKEELALSLNVHKLQCRIGITTPCRLPEQNQSRPPVQVTGTFTGFQTAERQLTGSLNCAQYSDDQPTHTDICSQNETRRVSSRSSPYGYCSHV